MRSTRKLLFSAYAALCLSFTFSPLILSGAMEGWYLDVPETSSTYDGVYYMTEQGLVEGYADGTFRPDEPVNRVEALKMILGATGHALTESTLQLEDTPVMDDPTEEVTDISEEVVETVTEINDEGTTGAESEATETPTEPTVEETSDVPETTLPAFPDVDWTAWYGPYVSMGYELKIMTGNDDGTLRPESTVNRIEAVKMLINASGRNAELPVVPMDTWYSAYLAFAQQNALLVPDSSGDYLPGEPLTRGELADLIYRFQKNPFAAGTVEYGVASYYGYSFDGHNTASGTALDAEGYMAAHKTLPFDTKVRVTNLDNGTFVDVTVVDRGPYTEGYVIDLTPAAFDQIGSLSAGLLHVRLEVLN